MKIGVDIRSLLESQYSGISEYTYNLLAYLLAIDKKNHYFLFYNSRKSSPPPVFNQSNVTLKGFNFPNRFFNLAIELLKVASIDKMIGGVDVFLSPHFLFSNLSKDCRKINIVHDLTFELYPEFFTFKKRVWHHLINPSKKCHDADKIIAISQSTKNDIVKIYNIPPEKITVIYNGINDKYFQPITDEQKNLVISKYNLTLPYILYLGNLEPRKNVESLVKAFGRLDDPNVHLVIAGSQAWKYKPIYQQWSKSQAKDRIKFLGYVDNNDKAGLYAAAKIFAYPSIYEGFGLPPLEAMACGAPVIAGANSALIESVADAGILVNPYNISEITEAIKLILTDDVLYNRLKEKGIKQSQKFRWENTANKILNILDSN
ncbi:MAG: glycosyltransferase family 1 protein [Patescibacteria group bacterium]|nr:glycosyltransferase family 1 protein [Patescibacteria group bacterium]